MCICEYSVQSEGALYYLQTILVEQNDTEVVEIWNLVMIATH